VLTAEDALRSSHLVAHLFTMNKQSDLNVLSAEIHIFPAYNSRKVFHQRSDIFLRSLKFE
jgi:hypothetical protein